MISVFLDQIMIEESKYIHHFDTIHCEPLKRYMEDDIRTPRRDIQNQLGEGED